MNNFKKHWIYYLSVLVFYLLFFILSRWPIFNHAVYYDVEYGESILDIILKSLGIDMHQRPLQVYSFSMVSHGLIYIIYRVKRESPHHLYKLLIYAGVLFVFIPIIW